MRQITTLLILAVGALVALSLTMLASAAMLESRPEANLRSQVLAALAGCVALAVATFVDLRRVGRWVWLPYAGSLVLLVLVLTPLGTKVNGAQRWLYGVQPSELAKLALILVLAWYGHRFGSRMETFRWGILGGGVICFPLFLLVLVEPDRGTAALLGLLGLVMLMLAGARWSHLLVPALGGAALLGTVIFYSPNASNRVNAWLRPEQHRKGGDHQLRQALYAFGEGGVEGRGLGRGSLKYNVPEMHTDFILPAVGEELGLPVTLGVVAAYLAILAAGTTIALRAGDRQGYLLAAGVTLLIAAQALINLGVVTGLFPNKGMPLPFVSRGGSSILVMLTMVGILLGVARQAAAPVESRPARRGRNPFHSEAEVAP